ncbi:NUDIX domain-containing protein [Marinibactrum halimedae]|uniref:GDP-mannose pyrophosphatase n=1 Tax=Marinibactrum halimedae TaxID=1444977 RepID=A0AA37T1P2_9GAMM|nr:NUDIX hydrolase [Marinibactrum halimedae]MCD9457551.1 NUDIX hydrolase [Marinibactrum halimedae]GLS25395.1 hypothetical protein GCM10007877_11090 [Marinibactrum halimedae]
MTKKIGAWEEKSKQLVYENPWIAVSHSEVITPAGTDGIYGTVHFKNKAIGIVPIDEEGFTWLVSQSRYPLGITTWEIPEGGSPEGEDPMETAQRELQEEVGLKAEHFECFLRLHLSNSVTDEEALVYLATGLQATETNHEETEDIQIKRLPLEDAVEMVHRGEITDAISVAALLKVNSLEVSG